MRRLERLSLVVLAVCLAVLLLASVLLRDWWTVALVAAVAVSLVSFGRRRRTSSRAAGAWDRDRVRTVTADARNEVEAVRRLRRADPALSLSDAVQLVRASAP